jgi:hypothetical protein
MVCRTGVFLLDIRTIFATLMLLPIYLGSVQLAWAQLPKRNLSVELRQVEERDASAYNAGATPQATSAPQWVLVRNGEKAHLRVSQTMTMQWVQSVASQSTVPGGAPGAAVALSNGMVMVESGQSLHIKPSWTGGTAPAVVEIELQATQLQTDAIHPIPQQVRSTVATVVEAPLGYWVVIATEGQSVNPGTYSSAGGAVGRKSLQIRVQAP